MRQLAQRIDNEMFRTAELWRLGDEPKYATFAPLSASADRRNFGHRGPSVVGSVTCRKNIHNTNTSAHRRLGVIPRREQDLSGVLDQQWRGPWRLAS